MSYIAAAAIVGGASLAGGLFSGFMGSSAAKKAASQQAAAIREATAFQRDVFNKTQANLKPYMDFGLQGTTGISEMLPYFKEQFPTLQASDVTQFGQGGYLAPYYDFIKNQGLQAIRQKRNVGGGGSNMDIASTKFAQDYAKTGIDQALGAQNQAYTQFTGQQKGIYDRLYNIAGLGENAAAMAGNQAVDMSKGIASTIAGAGSAEAGGTLGAQNAWNGAIQGITNAGSIAALPFMAGIGGYLKDGTLPGTTGTGQAPAATLSGGSAGITPYLNASSGGGGYLNPMSGSGSPIATFAV